MESAANGVETSTVVEAPVRKARADCEGLKRHPTRSLACESEPNLTPPKKKDPPRCHSCVLGVWGFQYKPTFSLSYVDSAPCFGSRPLSKFSLDAAFSFLFICSFCLSVSL